MTMPNERVITTQALEADKGQDIKLRPSTIDEFLGQVKVKEKISIFIEAARRRSQPLDHVLLYGPPGLGKTTLAHVIAHEMGVGLQATSGPILERVADLASILTNLSTGDVLFIDEIHRMNRIVEEYLYSAMEDYNIDLMIGEGASARSIKVGLNPFTLIGATTRTGLLTSPLRSRFGVDLRLDYYTPDELKMIVKRTAAILGIEVTAEGVIELAHRSRGTARIANRLLKRVRDYAEVRAGGVVDLGVAKDALEMLEIDSMGLDTLDRNILLNIIDKFNGGPVGIETISAAVSEDKDTLEEVYEPYLIRQGFLLKTPRGRVITPLAYSHLGMAPPLRQRPLFQEG